jgi:hypothetical protein
METQRVWFRKEIVSIKLAKNYRGTEEVRNLCVTERDTLDRDTGTLNVFHLSTSHHNVISLIFKNIKTLGHPTSVFHTRASII